MVWLPDGEKKIEVTFIHFGRIHKRDGETDGHRIAAKIVRTHEVEITMYFQTETFVCAQGTWQGQTACQISASYLYASCSYANMYFP